MILQGDSLTVLKTLASDSVDCIITSPPYWNMRDYRVDGQIGLEETPEAFIGKLIEVFTEAKRVLKKSGTCFVNLGDTYGTGSGKDEKRVHESVKGYKKSLLMTPERFALAMIGNGWKLRNKIIWRKKNAMPSSVIDRFSNKYELVYFFVKSSTYYFDLDAIRIPYETDEKRPDGIVRAREYGYNTKQGTKRRDMEDASRQSGKRRHPQDDYERNLKGKNPGDVWTLTLQPHAIKHIAMFPEKLITPMILAGCPKGGVVLDPFGGAMTTCVVAKKLMRDFIAIELNPAYVELGEQRIANTPSPLPF